jgi:hypothetical protein
MVTCSVWCFAKAVQCRLQAVQLCVQYIAAVVIVARTAAGTLGCPISALVLKCVSYTTDSRFDQTAQEILDLL